MINVSRQAVSRCMLRQGVKRHRNNRLIEQANTWRKEHPGCGVEKMFYGIKPEGIGRDQFIEVMMDAGFRLGRRRNYRKTTYPGIHQYPNLIKGLRVSSPGTVWQSDITYVNVNDKNYYAVFIIDVYTKKIVGYGIENHMRAIANVRALSMALGSHTAPKIHHSDRGSQYGSKEYIGLLHANGAKISMGKTPQDNAYAERINRTIKEEYLQYWLKQRPMISIGRKLKRAVDHYNTKRPHNHINRLPPENFEKQWCLQTQNKQPVIIIFDDNNFKNRST